MRRRAFLAVVGGVAITGCAGDETEEADDTTNGGDDDSGTSGDEGTEDDTETGGEPNVEIVDHELIVEEGDFSTEVYVDATVENTGDIPSGTIELMADWHDEDGNYLDNDSGYLQSLGAGETWNAQVRYLGSGSEAVADYEFDGEYETEPPEFNPDGLELLDSEMETGEDNVLIQGEIANETGDEASYIQVIGKLYGDDDLVLSDEWTNVTDVPADETWSFDLEWIQYDEPEEITDYEILYTMSSF